MKIIAHRGASGEAPENTLAAIQKALDYKVDAIEIDVRLSYDDEVFLMHDGRVNRTSNGRGLLRKMTATQLQALDAGSWFSPQFKGEGIPTLREVLSLCEGKTELLIEIKSAELDRYKILARKISALVQDFNAYKWVVVQSFDTQVLETIHMVDERLRISKLIVYNLGLAPVTRLYYDEKLRRGNLLEVSYLEGINVNYRYATKRLVNRIHKADKKIYCWTANKTRPMKRLLRLGVDGIITNYPNRLINVTN